MMWSGTRVATVEIDRAAHGITEMRETTNEDLQRANGIGTSGEQEERKTYGRPLQRIIESVHGKIDQTEHRKQCESRPCHADRRPICASNNTHSVPPRFVA